MRHRGRMTHGDVSEREPTGGTRLLEQLIGGRVEDRRCGGRIRKSLIVKVPLPV